MDSSFFLLNKGATIPAAPFLGKSKNQSFSLQKTNQLTNLTITNYFIITFLPLTI